MGLCGVVALSVRQFLKIRARGLAAAGLAALVAGGAGLGTAEANYNRRSRDLARKETQPPLPPGQLQIVINVGKQQLSLYSDGMLVSRSPVSTGTRSHPTPTGVFSIIQKRRHHVSNLYFAPMPFMQRLTWSGVALHQGALPGYPASHGCVRLPAAFAQTLWKTTKIGARVVIARQDAEPYAIAHALLPTPAQSAQTPSASAAAVKTAQADTVSSDATRDDSDKPQGGAVAAADALPLPDYPPPGDIMLDIRKSIEPNEVAEKPLPAGPVSVFVSRKTKRMYVRKGFTPLFDVAVEIRDEGKPFGTHVFTATSAGDGGMRWLALSLPVDAGKAERASLDIMREERVRARKPRAAAAPPAPALATPGAAEVLDRIAIPQADLQRLREMVTAGASFMVSDHPVSGETGEGTDFVVLTR